MKGKGMLTTYWLVEEIEQNDGQTLHGVSYPSLQSLKMI